MESETTVADLCDRYNVEATWEAKGFNVRDADNWEHNAYHVTLYHNGQRISTPWKQGIGIKEPPTASGVLSSLLLDASCAEDDFAEFCASLGYDEDSRKAYQLFKACRRVAGKLETFLGERMAEFMDADRD